MCAVVIHVSVLRSEQRLEQLCVGVGHLAPLQCWIYCFASRCGPPVVFASYSRFHRGCFAPPILERTVQRCFRDSAPPAHTPTLRYLDGQCMTARREFGVMYNDAESKIILKQKTIGFVLLFKVITKYNASIIKGIAIIVV